MSGRQKLLSSCSWSSNVLRLFKNLRDDQSGATYILIAFSMSVLMGMAGLGFDATTWYMNKRQIQTVADVSSLAGLEAMLNGEEDDEAKQAARDHSLRNEFENGVDGDVLVYVPAAERPWPCTNCTARRVDNVLLRCPCICVRRCGVATTSRRARPAAC